jgi:hypothetical protein
MTQQACGSVNRNLKAPKTRCIEFRIKTPPSPHYDTPIRKRLSVRYSGPDFDAPEASARHGCFQGLSGKHVQMSGWIQAQPAGAKVDVAKTICIRRHYNQNAPTLQNPSTFCQQLHRFMDMLDNMAQRNTVKIFVRKSDFLQLSQMNP